MKQVEYYGFKNQKKKKLKLCKKFQKKKKVKKGLESIFSGSRKRSRSFFPEGFTEVASDKMVFISEKIVCKTLEMYIETIV